MLGIAFLCLMVIRSVEANWEEKNDPSNSDLGFVVVNMTCNDKNTACGNCYVSRSHGFVYLNVFEYTENPYKVMASIEDAAQDWIWTFIQENPSETFRFCNEVELTSTIELSREMRAALCIDNDFEAITVPADCTKPIATVTMDTHFADLNINGQQTLYCIG